MVLFSYFGVVSPEATRLSFRFVRKALLGKISD